MVCMNYEILHLPKHLSLTLKFILSCFLALIKYFFAGKDPNSLILHAFHALDLGF